MVSINKNCLFYFENFLLILIGSVDTTEGNAHCTGQNLRIADIFDKYDVLAPSAHDRVASRLDLAT